MVDKKIVAAGVVAVAAVGTGVALALRGAEGEPPVEEGAPEGEVSLESTPQGRPEGFSFDDVKGAWGVGATINVNGMATAGFPAPPMLLELYDNDVVRKTTTVPSVVIGTTYTLTDTMAVADVGPHVVYGRMVLTNPLGSWEFTSPTQSFDIGEEPPGVIDIDVTLV